KATAGSLKKSACRLATNNIICGAWSNNTVMSSMFCSRNAETPKRRNAETPGLLNAALVSCKKGQNRAE
ncbi:MAG: hypothetical protein ACI9W2_000072, partial [Gammaproteobacteria bacterium]